MSYQLHAGAVRRFARLMRVAGWLQRLPQRLSPAPFRLLQTGSAFWQSRALYVAARLDIAGVLADDTLSADDIAARLHCDADAVARLLRFLAALGIFTALDARRFRNNATSAHLRREHPQCVRAMILMHGSETMSRPWYEQLETGIREGSPPFALTHGQPLFEYCDQHPDFDRLFSAAMDSVEALLGDSFARDFDWSRFDRLIDVGGRRGTKALAILRHHPQLQALVLDRPQVIAEARRHWAAQPDVGSERLQFTAADVLQGVPAAQSSREIFLLSALLHAFDDATAIRALQQLRRACGHSGAAIAVLELILPDSGADPAGTAFDMQMFMGTRGRERSEREWLALFAHSGLYREVRVHLQSFASIQLLRVAAD